jgi:hypothetical protein
MKTTTFQASLVAGLLALAWATPALAADKEITLHGDAKCAKCALKETAKCQTVIQVTEHGKTVNYYLAANDAAKKFHENVCHEAKPVTATGTDKVVNGKHEFTASKIELAKQ